MKCASREAASGHSNHRSGPAFEGRQDLYTDSKPPTAAQRGTAIMAPLNENGARGADFR